MDLIVNLILATLAIVIIGLPVIRHSEYIRINSAVREKASGKFIRLTHGYTHYDIAGPEQGPVVVFIHGFSVPYYMWDPTFKALSQAGFRVIRYDLYGRGLSDRPKLAYDRDLYVTQLSELLESLLLKEPVHLVGNSMGGAIVAAFAAESPERVERVVLIDPLFEKWQIGPFGIPLIGEYLTRSFLVPASPKRQLQDFFRPESFADWPKRFQEQLCYKGFGRALLSTLRNFLNQDPTHDYQKIYLKRKPVLLIWGADDRTLGTRGATKLYKILHPEFLWVEQAGHIPQYEAPEIVNPCLIEFLAAKTGLECTPSHA